MDTKIALPPGMTITARLVPEYGRVLTPDALAFVAGLCRQFEPRRGQLLAARAARQKEFDAGRMPDFLPETRKIRESEWRIAEQPMDLLDRRVEITGPTDRKMVINALNCGASTFMADLEDANCPTWDMMVSGQANLMDAAHRTISFEQNGKRYQLNEKTAVLIPRPRGWHLDEKHVTLDGKPICGALFDFGLNFFHNAGELLARGSGPYYYLPKMESHLEARLWNDIFTTAQKDLGVPHGSVRATVLIETGAFGRPQHRPLGLHLLVHQEAALPSRLLPCRPRPGDHDRALHARLCAAAGKDLPSPQRARHGRHGGTDPDQERSRRQ